MRHTAGALAVALAVSGALLLVGSRGIDCQAVADEAGLLTPSSRLEGAAEMLRRDGVDTLIHTARGPGTVDDAATRLAATCRQLERPDRPAALIVLHSRGDVAVLGVTPGMAAEARLAQATIASRMRATGSDPSSAVAVGLEQLWQANAAGVDASDAPAPASGQANPWAHRRLIDVGATAFGSGATTFFVLLLLGLARRRRSETRHAQVRAQSSRSALAQRYVDLDAAVIAAVARRRSAGREVPDNLTAALVAARDRATVALVDTDGSPSRRRVEALAAAAKCDDAERRLRDALRAFSDEAEEERTAP